MKFFARKTKFSLDIKINASGGFFKPKKAVTISHKLNCCSNLRFYNKKMQNVSIEKKIYTQIEHIKKISSSTTVR